MNWPADASNWMDVVDHAMVIVGAIVLAGVPSWFAARNHHAIKQIGKQADTIVGQVQNGHADQPLRGDLDRVVAAVETISRDIATLRSELADEHATRREQIRELRQDVDARLASLRDRLS